MIIRILPTQISRVWEAIKFACVQAEEVNKEDIPSYFNELLHALLSGKAQCFVRLGDDRMIFMLVVTRILIDKITGIKSLFIQALYSWKNVNDKEWQDDYNFIMEFAKHEQCKRISFESRNDKVWKIAKFLGFRENLRKFIFDVEA